MKSVVRVILFVISLICMGYGFYQMYLDNFVRPYIVLGYVGEYPYPDPTVSATIAFAGALLLCGLYTYQYNLNFWDEWKEETCPHCGKKVHDQEDNHGSQ